MRIRRNIDRRRKTLIAGASTSGKTCLLHSWFFLLSVLLYLGGCGLFETRTPEAPTQPQASYPLATTPQILIDNFQRSLTEAAVAPYVNCFVPDATAETPYQFIPAADAAAQFPDLFRQWSVATEQLFISNLGVYLQQRTAQLVLIQPRFEHSRPDSAIFQADYQFVFPAAPGGVPDTSSGTMQLHCIRALNGQWYIQRWFDQQRSDFPSFSVVKALLIR